MNDGSLRTSSRALALFAGFGVVVAVTAAMLLLSITALVPLARLSQDCKRLTR